MNKEHHLIETSPVVQGVMASEDHGTRKETRLNISSLYAVIEAALMIETTPEINTETLCSPLRSENST